MEVYISIDGVLRNTIQKFEYHYANYFLNSDVEEEPESIEIGDDGEVISNTNKPEPKFNYRIIFPIHNDDYTHYFTFQSNDEYNHFLCVEFPVEIFGHAGISYPTVFTDLHKIMYENQHHTYTIVGLDEMGKAKPSTLFFLSKNGFLGNNIRFIKSENLKEEWEKCDMWITDNEQIINLCPINKEVVKFNTVYNGYFTSPLEINKLTEINTKCLKPLEQNTTSI